MTIADLASVGDADIYHPISYISHAARDVVAYWPNSVQGAGHLRFAHARPETHPARGWDSKLLLRPGMYGDASLPIR
jgi:hypothetical protein